MRRPCASQLPQPQTIVASPPLHRYAAVLSAAFYGTARLANRRTKLCCCRSPKSPLGTTIGDRKGRSEGRKGLHPAPALFLSMEMNWLRVDPFRRVFQLRNVVWHVSHQAAEFQW